MILLGLIIGSLLLALIGALLWVIIDFRKYKKRNHLLFLLILCSPASLFAQLADKNHSEISIRWHNQPNGQFESVPFRLTHDTLQNT